MRSREEALIDAFIVPAKRNRYKSLLAKATRRKSFLDVLNHLWDLDPRYATEVSSGTEALALLRRRGAPELCHLISDVQELDGREMPLQSAIEQTEAAVWGTLIGCIPGQLAYYYGEVGEQRLVLERAPNQMTRPADPSGRR